MWSSTDLVTWIYQGLCTTESVTLGAYAPEVVYSNGKFYMYTSPGGNGHYVLSSSSPLGPFTLDFRKSGHVDRWRRLHRRRWHLVFLPRWRMPTSSLTG